MSQPVFFYPISGFRVPPNGHMKISYIEGALQTKNYYPSEISATKTTQSPSLRQFFRKFVELS